MTEQRGEIMGRIVGVYSGAGGWRDPDRELDFSDEVARMLRAEKVTIVRVLTRTGLWRRTMREVTLWRYLDGDQLSKEESTPTAHPIDPVGPDPEG